MKWRYATSRDVGILGEMNLRLIQDEKHGNPMSLPELIERMRGFLAGDYTAVVFEEDNALLGYALFHPQDDFLYIRQFFIERHLRRKGLGRAAIRFLIQEVLPEDKRIVVSVLSTNPDALEFWRATGFSDYCTTLEILPRKAK